MSDKTPVYGPGFISLNLPVCDECECIVRDADKHAKWHRKLNEDIGAAALVGQYSDMMHRPLGGER